MFWDAPPDYVPTAAERDLAARWLPSSAQIADALALLATLPAREEYVYVAIALPGKLRGDWIVGQPVEHLDGAWLNRDEASHAAVLHLGTRPGQPSYGVVWRDGHAAVFEDFRGLFEDDPLAPPTTTLPTGTVRLDSIPF
jgi:hypothetical protein